MGWFDILKNTTRMTLDGVEYQLNKQQMDEWSRLSAQYEGNPRFMRLNDGGKEARKRALRRIINQFNLQGKNAQQGAAQRRAFAEEADRAFRSEIKNRDRGY